MTDQRAQRSGAHDERRQRRDCARRPHRDGHQYAALVVLRREAITGGQTKLLPLDGKEPFYETVIEPNQALVFDDRIMRHFTTPIEPVAVAGYRDNLIMVFNEWSQRRYGAERRIDGRRWEERPRAIPGGEGMITRGRERP